MTDKAPDLSPVAIDRMLSFISNAPCENGWNAKVRGECYETALALAALAGGRE